MRAFLLPAPVRAAARIGGIVGWSVLCSLALWAVRPLRWVAEPRWRTLRRAIALRWVTAMPRLAGSRIIVRGTPPKRPFFLVLNHVSWIDMFAMNALCDATYVVEEPVSRIPIMGRLFRALDPIFVRRTKEDTPRVRKLMTEALRRGESLVMAPETPVTTLPIGSGVRQFRAGLLGAAVDACVPVHCMSLTYRTPAGWPRASKVVPFGPNPFYQPEGSIPETERAAFEGVEHSFFKHIWGVFSLPWHEFIARFDPSPISHADRIVLANALHDRVEAMFVPFR